MSLLLAVTSGAPPPVTGTLASTLGAAVLASAGAELFTGTEASTLGAAVLNASGGAGSSLPPQLIMMGVG